MSTPAFTDWIDRARSADIVQVAQRLGAPLKKVGNDWKSYCPACTPGQRKSDRFVVTPRNPEPKRRWMCRGSGGGDVIDMVEHVVGCDFVAAVQEITGEPPPKGAGRRIEPDILRERREERLENTIKAMRDTQKAEARKIETARDLWESGRDIFGTHGDKYFRNRGIQLSREVAIDLRFIQKLEYHGYLDENSAELELLGEFPCVLAAMRDVSGELIAVHRTYIDPRAPKKLVPPGDSWRNKAKKVFGKGRGGMIKLGFISRVLAVGEGIETTLSFRALGFGGDECSFASAYSLGNLSGQSEGYVPHPKFPDDKSKRIPNGVPRMDQPGIVLPECVEEVILIGDGDSDPAATRATLLTAARRFRAAGKVVSVAMAPDGKDFSNVLTESIAEG